MDSMFANEINESGNPICPACKGQIMKNDQQPDIDERGVAVSSKLFPHQLVILHRRCATEAGIN